MNVHFCPSPAMKGPLNLHGYYHPGFGLTYVKRNGKCVEGTEDVDGAFARPLVRAEYRARKEPRAVWEFVIDGPLSGAVYRRHGRNNWRLDHKLMGFA